VPLLGWNKPQPGWTLVAALLNNVGPIMSIAE
jgi:hypothetical protein